MFKPISWCLVKNIFFKTYQKKKSKRFLKFWKYNVSRRSLFLIATIYWKYSLKKFFFCGGSYINIRFCVTRPQKTFSQDSAL